MNEKDKWQIPVVTPGYVMLSSDFSAQEPRLTAFIGNEPKMIEAFQNDKDVYATIASIAFNVPYEKCLEFHPETHEYQPDGKARRTEAKSVLLGICYGRSIPSIADQLYGKDKSLTDDQKIKKAQKVFDSVMVSFPGLRKLMIDSQKFAKQHGYVETILGRRRHLPDMQLPEFEFKPMKGYMNPDIDPLDINTLNNQEEIPQRVIDELTKEFSSYKYFGQIVKRTKELAEQNIKVINNRAKINDATRQCLNCVDFETEILTTSGWKRYNEVNSGDNILAFDMDSQNIVCGNVLNVHIYNEPVEVVEFKSPTFFADSTLDHRWVVCESGDKAKFKTTSNIEKNKWPDYPILRVADNQFDDNLNYSDNELKLLGWIMTDGGYSKKYYGVELYQSTSREKNLGIYNDMIYTLKQLNIDYTDHCSDGVYHQIYLKQCDITNKIWKEFPCRTLTFSFISSLSQRQAQILMWAMIEVDGSISPEGNDIKFCCNSIQRRDVFQYLAFVAGYATNSYTTTPDQANSWNNGKTYDSINNSNPVVVRNNYYEISVLKVKRAHIYPHHKSRKIVDGVWCVTSNYDTWVARKDGKVFITGNSRVQGSAADSTKLAILMLENNDEWKKLGGRLLIPVHDELIAEVPMENWERGGELLSQLMCESANFLPFPSKCDVETSIHWYGLSYPCEYPEPKSLDNLTPDEVKWVQYHLFESEYTLPVYKDENGEKPRGDAAKGVNGIISDEYNAAIDDYCSYYKITKDEFIHHIHQKVYYGD